MTPLERAARVLCRIEGNPETATMEGKPLWQDYLPEVRAVIAAIRDPGTDAEDAGFDVGPNNSPLAYWQAMIDALLSEDGT